MKTFRRVAAGAVIVVTAAAGLAGPHSALAIDNRQYEIAAAGTYCSGSGPCSFSPVEGSYTSYSLTIKGYKGERIGEPRYLHVICKRAFFTPGGGIYQGIFEFTLNNGQVQGKAGIVSPGGTVETPDTHATALASIHTHINNTVGLTVTGTDAVDDSTDTLTSGGFLIGETVAGTPGFRQSCLTHVGDYAYNDYD